MFAFHNIMTCPKSNECFSDDVNIHHDGINPNSQFWWRLFTCDAHLILDVSYKILIFKIAHVYHDQLFAEMHFLFVIQLTSLYLVFLRALN